MKNLLNEEIFIGSKVATRTQPTAMVYEVIFFTTSDNPSKPIVSSPAWKQNARTIPSINMLRLATQEQIINHNKKWDTNL
jgi:hypothetical protein